MDSAATDAGARTARPLSNDRELGKAITRAEIAHDSGKALNETLWTTLPHTVHIIGVTGPPGAGKSTLTDKLIGCARAADLSVGVLAIDPSSPFSGGAILGDRIRMGHASDPGVFIRSMGNRTSLGGLALAARSTIRLLAEHGVDIVIVETVGVGQAELEIMHVADTVVVVMVPGMGDGVQMNKAGILEIGDTFVVNQCDRPGAKRTKMDLEQALMIGHRGRRLPTVCLTQATSGDGVDELWRTIRSHFEEQSTSGELLVRRLRGQREELADRVRRRIVRDLQGWLAGGEFLNLLGAKPVAAWSVDDLASRAAEVFLAGFKKDTNG